MPADGWTAAAENKPDLGSLGLNQYWYSLATIEALVGEIEAHAQGEQRVGFLSTPSLYFALASPSVQRRSTLFEFDERWADDARAIGGAAAFRFFDYNARQPLAQWRGTFDLLVIDPPFIDRKVWHAYIDAASTLLSEGGELLLTTVAEREDELAKLVAEMPQASGRTWQLARHKFEPINEGCAHRFCVFSTWPTAPRLDSLNSEPLPACSDIDEVDSDDDLLSGAIGRDAMLAISCESDSEEEGVTPAVGAVALPEPEPEPEPWRAAKPLASKWWQRNDRPFTERFVDPLRVPWQLPAAGAKQRGEEAGGECLTLQQSEGSGSDSDGQVTVWDAAIVLHRMLMATAAARQAGSGGGGLEKRRVVELGAGSGLVGITAARLGAAVCITDLGDVLPTLRANVAASCGDLAAAGKAPKVTELFWGTELPVDVQAFVQAGADIAEEEEELLILASDVVYLVQILPELAYTIDALCAAAATSGSRTAGLKVKVVLVNERRWADIDGWFLEALEKYFVFEALGVNEAVALMAGDGVGAAGGEDEVLVYVAGDGAQRFSILSLLPKST